MGAGVKDIKGLADLNVKILSYEECPDADYGASIVQYQSGEREVSFMFSNFACKDENLELIMQEIVEEEMRHENEKPLWSDISEELRNEITESYFDMHFIEYDHYWTEEKENAIWDEVVRLGLDGAVRCGEDGACVSIYAGAMGEVNWVDHPYYGEPCFDNVLIAPEVLKELKEKNDIYEYVDSYGDTNYVKFTLNRYCEFNNLYLGLTYFDPSLGVMDDYCDVTVNISNLPYLYSCIDTNNNGEKMLTFLIDNGFGELTGQSLNSGFCSYPIFRFSEEKLKEVCPQEFVEYQKAHGKLQAIDEKISNADKNRKNLAQVDGNSVNRSNQEEPAR